MEFVIAEIQKLIDGSERFEIKIDLFLGLTIFHQNYTAINYETVGRSLFVKLKLYVIGVNMRFYEICLLSLVEVIAVSTD